MNTTQASFSTKFKVGLFTFFGLLLIGVITVVVNNRPFWWRPCQLVKINVEDATGLKTKSPIRSLGIEIGYLKSALLTETHVTLKICITAPVEVLPSTRAYIRGEGFLGDKFVELKPVKFLGSGAIDEKGDLNAKPEGHSQLETPRGLLDFILPSAYAGDEAPTAGDKTVNEDKPTTVAPATAQNKKSGREIPVGEEGQDVQHLVNRVDELVNQMTGLTNNLKDAINPEDLKRTMKQLNLTLENASKTLAPEGGLNQTAQRTLAKLEDAIEQLRDQMTRVNKGQGSVGMLLNDPSYADEIRMAIKNINRLLNKVADVRFVVDIGGAELNGYNGGRGWFQLGIWPKPDRYYLIGISSDPRGRVSNVTTTTTAGGVAQVTQTQTVDQTGLLFTAMLGKVFFHRFDVSLGALYGDGAGSIAFRLGPTGNEEAIQLRNDVYFRSTGASVDDRVTLSLFPVKNIYLRAGVESFQGYPGNGQVVLFYGAGIQFDDEDIKLLFALK